MEPKKSKFLQSRFVKLLTQFLFPVIAIIISILLFVLSKEQKELTVTGLHITNLVETKDEVSNDVFVIYKEDTVYNTVRYQLEIKNTGNRSVTEQDIYNFIWIAPTGYQIIDVNIIGSEPVPISFTIVEPDSLKVDIKVMNKKTSFELSILCLTKDEIAFSKSTLNAIISDGQVIDKVNEFKKSNNDPFWKSIFLGNFWVQLVKMVIYFAIGFLIVLGIALPIIKLQELIKKRKVQKKIEKINRELPADIKEVKVKFPERFEVAYNELSKLNKNELDIVNKLVNTKVSIEERQEIAVNKALSKEEKEIYKNLIKSNKSEGINDIIEFTTIYYTKQLLEYFRFGKISSPLN